MEEQTQLAANKKSFDTWKEVQWNIAAIDNAVEFWGVLDIYQTIKLCKMLGIKCVLWANKTKFSELPIFKNMLQGESYIEFGRFPNAFEYYVNKYGKKNIQAAINKNKITYNYSIPFKELKDIYTVKKTRGVACIDNTKI